MAVILCMVKSVHMSIQIRQGVVMKLVLKSVIIFTFSLPGINAFSSECSNNIQGNITEAPPDIVSTLNSISKTFCLKQKERGNEWRHITITGIQRSPKKQASYIMNCLSKNGCSIYKNQAAIAEYKNIKNVTKEKIESKIINQIERNCYISKHLSSRAVDLATNNRPKPEVTLLVNIILNTEYENNGNKYNPVVVDKNHGKGAHLHVNFKPYGFDPVTCPLQ